MDFTEITQKSLSISYTKTRTVPRTYTDAAKAIYEDAMGTADSGDTDKSTDQVRLSGQKYAPDMDTVQRLQEELSRQIQDLSEKVLGRQASAYSAAFSFERILRDGNSITRETLEIKWSSQNFQLDDEDMEGMSEEQKEALESISENGYWGVNKTSDRLVQFAQALSGKDPAMLQTMIDAFEKGYGNAAKAWGTTLPDLCQKTREATLEKFELLRSADKDDTDMEVPEAQEKNVEADMGSYEKYFSMVSESWTIES